MSVNPYTPRYGAIYPSLADRAVLVTGGANGIGEAIARAFVQQGSKVGILDLDDQAGSALADELEDAGGTACFERVDLTDIPATVEAIQKLRTSLGPFSILINNAAFDQRYTIDETTPELWNASLARNISHQFFCARETYKDMTSLGGGAIINMGSCSYIQSFPNLDAYMSAKAGIIGLTRGLARELGEHNIRVNCVMPGWILTKRQLEKWYDEAGEQLLMSRQCVKRKLYPDDIARVVLFFASDEAGACTNQAYIADGGWV